MVLLVTSERKTGQIGVDWKEVKGKERNEGLGFMIIPKEFVCRGLRLLYELSIGNGKMICNLNFNSMNNYNICNFQL